MARSNNWPAYGTASDGIEITAGASSARTPLPEAFKGREDILIFNPGQNRVRIKALQVDSGAATLLNLPVSSGDCVPFKLGGCMWLATICEGGATQVIHVFPGEGA